MLTSRTGLILVVAVLLITPMSSRAQPNGSSAASGHAFLRMGKHEEARKHFRRAIELDPTDAQAHAGLVRSLLGLNQVDEARAAADFALTSAPGHAEALVANGEVAYREARFGPAREAFVEALQADPAAARAHLGLAMIWMSEARYRSAREQIERALQLDPNDPDIVLVWAYTRTGPGEGLAVLDRFLSEGVAFDAEKLEFMREYLEMGRALAGRRANQIADTSKLYSIRLSRLYAGSRDVSGYTMQVRFDNGKPVRLMLHMGGGGILLKERTARRLNLQPLAGRSVKLSVAEQVRIGDLEVRNCAVGIGDGYMPQNVDGLLSPALFEDFLIRIDPGRDVMELIPRDEQGQERVSLWNHERGSYTPGFHPVRQIGKLLLMPVQVNEIDCYFVILAGTPFNMVSNRMLKRSSRREQRLDVRPVEGGKSDLLTAPTVLLEFAGFRQRIPDLQSADTQPMSKAIGAEISGILGFEALSQLVVEIDYRDGFVRFTRAKTAS